MASTKKYKEFILEQLDKLDEITCKPMIGEYLLYYKEMLFGGIYDDRLLIKIVDTNKKYKLPTITPYKGAKGMYLVNDVKNQELLKEIVIDSYVGLKNNVSPD